MRAFLEEADRQQVVRRLRRDETLVERFLRRGRQRRWGRGWRLFDCPKLMAWGAITNKKNRAGLARYIAAGIKSD